MNSFPGRLFADVVIKRKNSDRVNQRHGAACLQVDFSMVGPGIGIGVNAPEPTQRTGLVLVDVVQAMQESRIAGMCRD